MSGETYGGMAPSLILGSLVAEGLDIAATQLTFSASFADKKNERYWEDINIIKNIARGLRGETVEKAPVTRNDEPRDTVAKLNLTNVPTSG